MPIFWSLLMFTVHAEAEAPNLSPNNIQYIRSQGPKEQLQMWEKMESSSKEKRLERAEALFFIPNSAELAIDLLRKETDPEIKQTLLLCVGKHGQASQIQILLTILQQKAVLLPSDSAIAALRALSMMGSRGKLTTNRIELAAMLLQQRLVIDPIQRRLVATIIAQLEIPALPFDRNCLVDLVPSPAAQEISPWPPAAGRGSAGPPRVVVRTAAARRHGCSQAPPSRNS